MIKKRRIKCSKYAPICKWLPKYNQYQAVGDFIAGITIGLTMIPQSIAYASLAGLDPQYGLYSSFLGGFLYAIFGSVKEISIGPTSLMALLTIEFTKGKDPNFVILLTFLTGCIEMIMGMLDLGFLVDFISVPVTSGFTSATSVIIIATQLKGLLGLKFTSEALVDSVMKVYQHRQEIRVEDTLLGVSSIIVLLFLRSLKDVKLSPDRRVMAKTLWFISVGRNALVVLVCSVASFYMTEAGLNLFMLSGQVRSGLPSFNFPKFSTVDNNQTYNFFEMCSHLGSGIVILPLVSVLANVAIAKVFASGALNASQEMRTLGLCNLLGSCVGSMPTCGAFTRSAVSHTSGIQTPFAGIYSGLMTIFALSFLTTSFKYIPKPVLSAVLISAVIFLIDWKIVHNLWRGSKRDAVATAGTFIVCVLFSVELGLLLGIVSNIIYLLYLSARPAIKVTECTANLEYKYLLIQPDVGLFFPAVDFVTNKVSEIADERGDDGEIPLVLDCQRFRGIDYTAVKGLEKLAKQFREKEQKLWFLNLNDKVAKSIKKLGDLNSLKILKSESDIIAALCGIEMNNVHVQFVNEYSEKDIPMKDVIGSTSPEAESLIAKEKKVDYETEKF